MVENNVLQALKDSMGKREATDIPSERNDALASARKTANELVSSAIGVEITGMTMPNFEFNNKFKNSIAEASQMKAEAERARQAVEKTKAEADSVAAKAAGDARAKRELADADLYVSQKNAEAQKALINVVGKENLSAYWFKETWNGELPKAVGGSNVNVMDMSAVVGTAMPKAPAVN